MSLHQTHQTMLKNNHRRSRPSGPALPRVAAPMVAAAAAMLLMVGCSTLPPVNPSTEVAQAASAEQAKATVMQRANEYWQAMLARDLVAAWPYEALSRDPNWTLNAYVRRGGLVYEQVDVLGVRLISPTEAQVDIRTVYSVPLARIRGAQAQFEERWVLLDGVWLRVQPN